MDLVIEVIRSYHRCMNVSVAWFCMMNPPFSAVESITEHSFKTRYSTSAGSYRQGLILSCQVPKFGLLHE